MRRDYDDDNEVDVSTFFKQEASDLASVGDLNGTLKSFGFSSDDRINRRELVLMYGAVNKEMEKEIFSLANSSRYEGAKEMRGRLTRIRTEFDSLQTTVVKTNQRDQCAFFEKAIKQMDSDLDSTHRSETESMYEDSTRIETERHRLNAIEWENLELQISRIPRPSVKYSKRVIELVRAENGLIKLNQYDDARKVRVMLDRLIPGEEEKCYKVFDALIELKRKKLRDTQAQKTGLLTEKMKGRQWTDHRRIEREEEVAEQRTMNHTRDMNHAHLMEEKLRPEMSVKPSALWQKRAGHERTAASLRGQQLLYNIRSQQHGEGGAEGGGNHRVFAESLVNIHDFDNLSSSTRQLR